MMLGSFQCQGIPLLWQMVGAGTCTGAGWVGFFFFSAHLSYQYNVYQCSDGCAMSLSVLLGLCNEFISALRAVQ